MPDVEFYAETQDDEELVRFYLELGFIIVPDITYETPCPMIIKDWTGYETLRAFSGLFFLLDSECQISPLKLFQIGGANWNTGKYAIYQRQGGPALKYVRTPPHERDGIRRICSGLLSYYPTYKNTLTGHYEKVPQTLRNKYRRIAKRIRQISHPVEFECIGGGVRQFRILPHALKALELGAKLAGTIFNGFAVRGLEQYPEALETPQPLPSGPESH